MTTDVSDGYHEYDMTSIRQMINDDRDSNDIEYQPKKVFLKLTTNWLE